MTRSLPAALFLVAASLVFFIDARFGAIVHAGGGDVLSRMLGSSKEILGDTLFLKADEYFHGGVPHAEEETEEQHAKEGFVEESARPELPADWVAVVRSKIQSHEHYHLTEGEQKEMLPLFSLALQWDPHNIEAILTTSYWLERRLGKKKEAEEVLRQGIRQNPGDQELQSELRRFLERNSRAN